MYRTVFDAEYLVLGLGDVYLGAPVATPLDPRHRLVTTKYNPARTWTPENSVGIGGAYLCVYGMEGPGGYQFVGPHRPRCGSGWQQRGAVRAGLALAAALLRPDPWYPVDADELLDLRADIASGRFVPRIEEGTFSLAEHQAFLADERRRPSPRSGPGSRRVRRRAGRLGGGGRVRPGGRPRPHRPPPAAEVTVPPGGRLVEAEFAASVWQLNVEPGDAGPAGQPLLALEAMKMESRCTRRRTAWSSEILTRPGAQVERGRRHCSSWPGPRAN